MPKPVFLQSGQFNGVDDYVEVAHNNNMKITDAGSITAWLNISSLGGEQVVFSKWIPGQYSYYLSIDPPPGNQLVFQADPDGNAFEGNGCAFVTTSEISALYGNGDGCV